jgi:UDP-N-acetylglucosamine 2-epimerase (non-hydrolysing)
VVAVGAAKLLGTDPDRIVTEVWALLDDKARYAEMSQGINPFGDGKASARIVEAMIQRNTGLQGKAMPTVLPSAAQ